MSTLGTKDTPSWAGIAISDEHGRQVPLCVQVVRDATALDATALDDVYYWGSFGMGKRWLSGFHNRGELSHVNVRDVDAVFAVVHGALVDDADTLERRINHLVGVRHFRAHYLRSVEQDPFARVWTEAAIGRDTAAWDLADELDPAVSDVDASGLSVDSIRAHVHDETLQSVMIGLSPAALSVLAGIADGLSTTAISALGSGSRRGLTHYQLIDVGVDPPRLTGRGEQVARAAKSLMSESTGVRWFARIREALPW